MGTTLTKEDVFSNIKISMQDLQGTIDHLETREDLTLIDLIGIRIAIQRITFKVEQM